jgi:predicted nucleotidyltransferase
VDQAVREWVEQQVQSGRDILRAGYFGSYARGDWGVSSDLDLILIVRQSDQPFWQRSLQWDVMNLPLPVDLLVYTREEWQNLVEQRANFAQSVEKEAVWVYQQ